MEGVPRIPMLSYPMRRSADTPNLRPKFKNFISSHYNESPDAYTAEIEELQTLRASATHVSKDLTGCSTLKKYFCQLNFLKSRFPLHEGSPIAVTYSWYDIYSETVHGWADIDFEMSCILYNIGALHTELGTLEARQTPEGMKVACTHFQCAAWAFQHLRHNYPKFFTPDLSPDLLSVIYNICLGQAQECILEKSLIDNRKSTITAKVALQIVEYYQLALQTCEQMLKDSSQYSDKFMKAVKKWKKLVELKISYYSSMGFLYRGFQSEDQQKWGERVTFFRAAKEKLEAAFKLAKVMEKTDTVHDTLTFTMDVIVGKLTVSEKDNEFIYHEKIPDLDAISSDIKGVSLVKAIPFKFDDPSIAGADIFGRLVPIEAHEASSLYSEEKAKVLRTYSAKIEEKNEALDKFLIALQLDHLDLHSNELKIPQELIDCCAALSVNKDVVKVLSDKMSNLSGRFHDVESNLNEVLQILKDEEAQEREYQEIVGKRASSNVLTELSREAHKYQHAQTLASESNQTLHEVMKAHVSNMNILIKPLDEVLKHIPSASDIEQKDEESIYEMKRLACKVDEMRKQRQSLENQLRDSIHADDITKSLVVKKDEDLDVVFKEELKKHDHITQVLDQNLLAQENITRALTEANANYAETRIATVEVIRNRNQAIQSLLSSYEAYDELLVKCEKGIQFYGTLDENVSKLLQRVKSVCTVQNEEREQTKKLLQSKQAAMNMTVPPPSSFSSYPNPNDPYNAMQNLPNPMDLPPISSGSGGGTSLKDYLARRKAQPVAVDDTTGTGGQRSNTNAPYSSASAQYQQYQYPQTTPTPTPTVTPRPGPGATTNYGQHNGSQYTATPAATAPPAASQQNQNYSAQYSYGQGQGQGQYYTQYNTAGTSAAAAAVAGQSQYQTQNQYARPGTAASANPSVGQNTATPASTSYQYQPYSSQQQQPAAVTPAGSVYSHSQGQGQTTNPNNTQAYSNTGQYPSAVSAQQPYGGQQQQQQYPGSTTTAKGQQQYSYPQTQTTVASYQQPQPYSSTPASAYYQPVVTTPQISTPYYQQQQQPAAVAVAGTTATTVASNYVQPQQQPQAQSQYGYNSASAYNQYYSQQPPSVAATNTTTTYTQPQYSAGLDTGVIEKQKYLSTYDKPTYPHYGAQQQQQPQAGYGQYGYYGQQQPTVSGITAASYGGQQQQSAQAYTSTSQSQAATPYGQQQQQPTAPYANATAPVQQQPAASTQYANPAQQQQQQQAYTQQQQQQQQGYSYNYATQNSGAPNVYAPQAQAQAQPQRQPQQAPVTSSKNLDLLADIDLSGAQVMPLAPVICHSASAASTSAISTATSVPQTVTVADLPRPQLSEPTFNAGATTATTASPMATVSEPTLSVQDDTTLEPRTNLSTSSSGTEIPVSLLNGTKKPTKIDPLADPAVLSKFSIEVEKLNHLIEAFHKKSLNGPTNLDLKWRELLDIQNAESVKRSISVARCYPMKNRFPDILPYDQSRVPLPSTKDDYINASFLKDLSPSAIPFIATQAPLPVTFADFWHMIWHYSVELIVCLTNEADLKGHIYWPVEKGKDLALGPFKISLQTCNAKPTFIERIVTVCQRDLKQTRVVIHLQFTEWGGNVFPVSPAPLLSFVNEVHSFYEQQRNLKRPVVLHCIPGVGKTGVFSTLSSALKEINSGNGIVDLVTCAGTACEQRKGLMIDKEYLRFTYHCLLYYCQDLLMKRGILSARTTFDKKPKVHTHTRHPSQDFLSDPFKKIISNSNEYLVPSSAGSGSGSTNNAGDESGSDAKDLTSSGESSRRSSYTSSPIRTINNKNTNATKQQTTTTTTSKPSSIYSDVPSSLTNVDPGTFRQITKEKEKEILKVDIREAFESGKGALLERKTEGDPFDPLSSLDPLWTIKK